MLLEKPHFEAGIGEVFEYVWNNASRKDVILMASFAFIALLIVVAIPLVMKSCGTLIGNVCTYYKNCWEKRRIIFVVCIIFLCSLDLMKNPWKVSIVMVGLSVFVIRNRKLWVKLEDQWDAVKYSVLLSLLCPYLAIGIPMITDMECKGVLELYQASYIHFCWFGILFAVLVLFNIFESVAREYTIIRTDRSKNKKHNEKLLSEDVMEIIDTGNSIDGEECDVENHVSYLENKLFYYRNRSNYIFVKKMCGKYVVVRDKDVKVFESSKQSEFPAFCTRVCHESGSSFAKGIFKLEVRYSSLDELPILEIDWDRRTDFDFVIQYICARLGEQKIEAKQNNSKYLSGSIDVQGDKSIYFKIVEKSEPSKLQVLHNKRTLRMFENQIVYYKTRERLISTNLGEYVVFGREREHEEPRLLFSSLSYPECREKFIGKNDEVFIVCVGNEKRESEVLLTSDLLIGNDHTLFDYHASEGKFCRVEKFIPHVSICGNDRLVGSVLFLCEKNDDSGVVCTAVLDTGSPYTIIQESIVEDLGLKDINFSSSGRYVAFLGDKRITIKSTSELMAQSDLFKKVKYMNLIGCEVLQKVGIVIGSGNHPCFAFDAKSKHNKEKNQINKYIHR